MSARHYQLEDDPFTDFDQLKTNSRFELVDPANVGAANATPSLLRGPSHRSHAPSAASIDNTNRLNVFDEGNQNSSHSQPLVYDSLRASGQEDVEQPRNYGNLGRRRFLILACITNG